MHREVALKIAEFTNSFSIPAASPIISMSISATSIERVRTFDWMEGSV
jgi:hypothetical protein